ncbi:NUDIX domain-containing protein [Kitasatospora sp. NBC_01300]|uniref:NUDIX domain-containing protein n=1 Tax=Kitasatospora sp. NBC_01300 TaxID=2903574 RepID=UPI00352FDAAA
MVRSCRPEDPTCLARTWPWALAGEEQYVEARETILDALHRETSEETGLTIGQVTD